MSLNEDFVTPPHPARNGHDKGSNGHDRPKPGASRPRWDRGPQPALAKHVARALWRRARALAKARLVLTRKTHGIDAVIAERLRVLAEVYAAYRAAGALILELELL